MRRAGRALARAAEVLWVVLLAGAILVPFLPGEAVRPFRDAVVRAERAVSVQQHWGMYAPHPELSQAYMELSAVWPDGSVTELEETEAARNGWGTTWFGRKTRRDIWRYYARLHPTRPNRNRAWYLRMVCVREARRTGRIPREIRMRQVMRRFAPPRAVRSGKLPLGRPRVRDVARQSCTQRSVRAMIHADPFAHPDLRAS